MSKLSMFLLAAVGAVSVQAADVEQLIVRQQWPWSTDIKVEYRLSGVDTDHPVDLQLKAFNGETELALPDAAIDGDRYGITNPTGVLTIDPEAAFGEGRTAISDFKVQLSVKNSAANVTEVVYKIFDLLSGACTDVTRADLYNGKYGAYETEFSAVGKDFTTELDDVLIWTGVTNDIAYKTSKMVMRKIPAKGKSYTMLPGTDNAHTVSFSNDYFVAVFELTEGQWLSIVTNTTVDGWATDSMYFTNELYRYSRPLNGSFNMQMRGYCLWPTGGHETVGNKYPLQRFRERLKTSSALDQPTEALWEYAARAGVWSAKLPSGLDTGLKDVARYRFNAASKPYADTLVDKNADTTDGTNEVGSYAPNAWGLYDVVGNVGEWCLDVYAADISDQTGVDPWGPPVNANQYNVKHVFRGGHYYTEPEINTRASNIQGSTSSGAGFRLCLTVY